MSKLNLLMKFVTISLTFILISCSKSEPSDPTYTHLVEVRSGGVSGIYFVDAEGVRLNPTVESIIKLDLSGIQFIEGISYIQYRVVSDETPLNSSRPGPFTIEVFGGVSIDRDFAFTDNTHVADFAPTAPIVCLGNSIESIDNIFLFNNRYLLLEVNYFLGIGSNGKAKPHNFIIVYNSDETTSASTNLKLHLSHDSNGDIGYDFQSIQIAQSDITLYYMTFDLSSAIGHFKQETGKNEFVISITTDIASEYYQTIADATQKEYLYNYEQ